MVSSKSHKLSGTHPLCRCAEGCLGVLQGCLNGGLQQVISTVAVTWGTAQHSTAQGRADSNQLLQQEHKWVTA